MYYIKIKDRTFVSNADNKGRSDCAFAYSNQGLLSSSLHSTVSVASVNRQ